MGQRPLVDQGVASWGWADAEDGGAKKKEPAFGHSSAPLKIAMCGLDWSGQAGADHADGLVKPRAGQAVVVPGQSSRFQPGSVSLMAPLPQR